MYSNLNANEIFTKLGWKVSTAKPSGAKNTHMSVDGKLPMALRLLEKSKKRKLEEH